MKTGREAGGGQFAFVHVNDGTAFESIQVGPMSQSATIAHSYDDARKLLKLHWTTAELSIKLVSHYIPAGGLVQGGSRARSSLNEACSTNWNISSH